MSNVARKDDPRWDSVVRRDGAADGQFFYAVKTTGVYCRPSCAARLPRRENVTFFTNAADARAAGFRPCKRCRPDDRPLADRRADLVARACRLLDRVAGGVDLDAIARKVGMSRFHFQRVFKTVTGVTPLAYVRAVRARRVRDGLERRATVTDAILDAGFGSSSRFYSRSDATLGMRPRDYRAGGAGTAVQFAVGECSLGSILVAATPRGICAILLGDDPDALTRELQDLFPNAELQPGNREFERWMAAVIGLVEQPRTGVELPLDVQGTAFQQRVWRALTSIPVGATRSYADIARQVGAPEAVRAVAAACAANKLAVAIPCHRVVRKDGSLSGYRWGVERKRSLLEREAAELAR
jgi:AraC family transcriptional regulator of adaptative response/methylated-DNA-[protein]-cysteine methyltransferase